jgi:hypothetical protein
MSNMTLVRTTKICAEDPNARQLLLNTVNELDTLWVLVLGNDAKAQTAVELADLRAQTPPIAGFERKVVWITSREFFRNVFNDLGIVVENSDSFLNDLEDIVAFGLSPDKKIKGVVKINDTLDLAAMENLFLQAGQK